MNDRRAGVIAYYLEKKALGEISPEEQQTLDQAMSRDEQEQRCRNILADSEAIRREFPAMQAVPVDETRTPSIPGKGRGVYWMGPLALVALLLVFLYPKVNQDIDGIRIKGEQSGLMHVYQLTGEGTIREVKAGETVRSETLLQIKIAASQYRYAALFFVDVRGQVTTILAGPSHNEPYLLPKGEEVTLPQALQLDEASGEETFYAFFSDERFDVESLRGMLAAGRHQGRAPKDWERDFSGAVEVLAVHRGP